MKRLNQVQEIFEAVHSKQDKSDMDKAQQKARQKILSDEGMWDAIILSTAYSQSEISHMWTLTPKEVVHCYIQSRL